MALEDIGRQVVLGTSWNLLTIRECSEDVSHAVGGASALADSLHQTGERNKNWKSYGGLHKWGFPQMGVSELNG